MPQWGQSTSIPPRPAEPLIVLVQTDGKSSPLALDGHPNQHHLPPKDAQPRSRYESKTCAHALGQYHGRSIMVIVP
ncbi:unnamed protein product [Zymoseptoria tritici ST99CH_3D7]|uniref:Uncharacterized protein n=1 Tax=Zymoseptoria tritici (strain ST99CH_3D7) TaxID=1276538 RepID=A0A1X7S233_ZYMT9|nr:unnamed protein product [Zymoseptoria tritici ST99CH_3D7]